MELPHEEEGGNGDVPDAGGNPYELQRLQIIARNRARLIALGLPDAVSDLAALKAHHPRPKKHKAEGPGGGEPEAPSRVSDRLRDKELIARGEVPPDVEPASELALFIINGECPKCGKVRSVGHARHLEVCQGPPEPPTEEEIAAQAEVYRQQQDSKVRELELGGLVEYVPTAAAEAAGDDDDSGGHAIFIVIGSTGKHYAIKLTDAKRTCACPDHRMRKRDCKHIKLILQQLGITTVKASYAGWEQALCEHLDALGMRTADDADIEAVQEAEARAAARKAKATGKASKPSEAAAATAAAAGGDGEEEGDEAVPASGGKGGAKRKQAGGAKGGAKKKKTG